MEVNLEGNDTKDNILPKIAKFQLDQAETLLSRINEFLETPKGKNIHGLKKLQKRVVAERNFLLDIQNGQIKLEKSHVECSNLGYLTAIIDIVEVEVDVIGVQKVFLSQVGEDGKKERNEIDIVSRNGLMWIKVKAMKPETIQCLYFGNGTFGSKGLDSIAEQMIECASQHLINYNPPTCVFWFVNGVTKDVVEDLESIGIVSHGKIVKIDETVKGKGKQKKELDESYFDIPKQAVVSIQEGEIIVNTSDSKIANLDITTLICYVSHIANEFGKDDQLNEDEYSDLLLQQQAEEESKCPVLPIIEEMIKGKKLIVTKCAWERFWSILEVIGGEREKERALKLKENVEIVENNPSEKALSLTTGNKIKDQHIQIFGTGDQLKAVTITANSSFVRIASEHGVDFHVLVHPARALTEQKIKKKNSNISDNTNNNNTNNTNNDNNTNDSNDNSNFL